MAFIKKTLAVKDLAGVTDGSHNIVVKAVSELGESDASAIVSYDANAFNYEWDGENTCYIVTGINDATITNVQIPSTHEGHNVGAIGEGAFMSSAMTSVTIPNTIQRIGKSAFQNCDSLTDIEIPESVTYIGISAFASCNSLASVRFVDNSRLTEIDNFAFQSCSALATIDLPSSLQRIGTWVFDRCSSLYATASYETGTFRIPSGVTTIGAFAFSECGAYFIDLDDTQITTINTRMFTNCPNLVGVNARSATLTHINERAFEGCSVLESVTVTTNLEWIARRAFYECPAFTGLLWCIKNTVGGWITTQCPPGWFSLAAVQINSGVYQPAPIPSQIYVDKNAGLVGRITTTMLTSTHCNKYLFRISKMQTPYVKLDSGVLTIADTTYLATSFKIYVTNLATGEQESTTIDVNEADKDPTGVVEDYIIESASTT